MLVITQRSTRGQQNDMFPGDHGAPVICNRVQSRLRLTWRCLQVAIVMSCRGLIDSTLARDQTGGVEVVRAPLFSRSHIIRGEP